MKNRKSSLLPANQTTTKIKAKSMKQSQKQQQSGSNKKSGGIVCKKRISTIGSNRSAGKSLTGSGGGMSKKVYKCSSTTFQNPILLPSNSMCAQRSKNSPAAYGDRRQPKTQQQTQPQKQQKSQSQKQQQTQPQKQQQPQPQQPQPQPPQPPQIRKAFTIVSKKESQLSATFSESFLGPQSKSIAEESLSSSSSPTATLAAIPVSILVSDSETSIGDTIGNRRPFRKPRNSNKSDQSQYYNNYYQNDAAGQNDYLLSQSSLRAGKCGTPVTASLSPKSESTSGQHIVYFYRASPPQSSNICVSTAVGTIFGTINRCNTTKDICRARFRPAQNQNDQHIIDECLRRLDAFTSTISNTIFGYSPVEGASIAASDSAKMKTIVAALDAQPNSITVMFDSGAMSEEARRSAHISFLDSSGRCAHVRNPSSGSFSSPSTATARIRLSAQYVSLSIAYLSNNSIIVQRNVYDQSRSHTILVHDSANVYFVLRDDPQVYQVAGNHRDRFDLLAVVMLLSGDDAQSSQSISDFDRKYQPVISVDEQPIFRHNITHPYMRYRFSGPSIGMNIQNKSVNLTENNEKLAIQAAERCCSFPLTMAFRCAEVKQFPAEYLLSFRVICPTTVITDVTHTTPVDIVKPFGIVYGHIGGSVSDTIRNECNVRFCAMSKNSTNQSSTRVIQLCSTLIDIRNVADRLMMLAAVRPESLQRSSPLDDNQNTIDNRKSMITIDVGGNAYINLCGGGASGGFIISSNSTIILYSVTRLYRLIDTGIAENQTGNTYKCVPIYANDNKNNNVERRLSLPNRGGTTIMLVDEAKTAFLF